MVRFPAFINFNDDKECGYDGDDDAGDGDDDADDASLNWEDIAGFGSIEDDDELDGWPISNLTLQSYRF